MGRLKEKERKGTEKGLVPLGMSCERENSLTLGPTSPAGRSARADKKLQRLKRRVQKLACGPVE